MAGGTAAAVLAWWPGDDPDALVGWWSVTTWGRIGKAAQYVGGLVALVDIIGESRLSTAADRITEAGRRVQTSSGFRRGLRGVLLGTLGVVLGVVLGSSLDVPQVLSAAIGAVAGVLVVVFDRSSVGIRVINGTTGLAARAVALGPELLARVARSVVNLKVVGFVIVTLGFVLDFAAS